MSLHSNRVCAKLFSAMKPLAQLLSPSAGGLSRSLPRTRSPILLSKICRSFHETRSRLKCDAWQWKRRDARSILSRGRCCEIKLFDSVRKVMSRY